MTAGAHRTPLRGHCGDETYLARRLRGLGSREFASSRTEGRGAILMATFIGVGEWLDRREALTPDKVGLIDADTGERYTYRTLNTRARALAAMLAGEYAVRQGDRV